VAKNGESGLTSALPVTAGARAGVAARAGAAAVAAAAGGWSSRSVTLKDGASMWSVGQHTMGLGARGGRGGGRAGAVSACEVGTSQGALLHRYQAEKEKACVTMTCNGPLVLGPDARGDGLADQRHATLAVQRLVHRALELRMELLK
jgi:hypothetical protein